MGTPNFASPSNASKYFVVLTGQEVEVKVCPECEHNHRDWEFTLSELKECEMCKHDLSEVEVTSEYVYPESWECDDFISNMGYVIKEIGGVKENEYLNDNRSYPSQTLGKLTQSKSYGEVELEVVITAILTSAYYEGATLDYLIHVNTHKDVFKYSTGSSYDNDIDTILDDAFDRDYSTDMNAGLCAIFRPKAEAWVKQTITDLSEKLEKLFEDYSSHKLTCKGVFSNGEAVYESI